VLGVSIVLYRSAIPPLLAGLRALAAQTLPPASIAVHANASTQSELDAVRASIADAAGPVTVHLTSSTDNQGFSGAHNRGLAQLFTDGCTAVVVHNPDLVLEPTALAELHTAEQRVGAPALLGPLLELADAESLAGLGLVDSLGIRWTRSGRHLDDGQGAALPALTADPRPVAGISGACLYVPRAAYDVVVGVSQEFFDEEFIAYREDAELAYRASLLGVPSYLVPAARGRHVRRLRGTTRGDPMIDRLGVRNRFLIAAKYGRQRPGGAFGPLLRDGVVVMGTLLRERSSLPGLADAWRLRRQMRAKGRVVRQFAASRH
jgi:GT2 family glycosyltransferase